MLGMLVCRSGTTFATVQYLRTCYGMPASFIWATSLTHAQFEQHHAGRASMFLKLAELHMTGILLSQACLHARTEGGACSSSSATSILVPSVPLKLFISFLARSARLIGASASAVGAEVPAAVSFSAVEVPAGAASGVPLLAAMVVPAGAMPQVDERR